MKQYLLAGAALLCLSAPIVLAQGSPESLLPPGFDDPSPAPSPRPSPSSRPSASPRPAQGQQSATGGGQPDSNGMVSNPVVQQLPSSSSGSGSSSRGPSAPVAVPSGLPTLEQLEAMDVDQLDELLGLKPKYDIPPASRRSLDRVGVVSMTEGGLPSQSLAQQPGSIVSAALQGTKGPLVSRWGHIMLRRALASRLASPVDMDPVDFAAMRAGLLNRMGEFAAARALVQDVDTSNWNSALTSNALAAYLGTADITGACPVIRLRGGADDNPQRTLWKSICAAYAGEGSRASSELDRALRKEIAPDIDVLLAQRYAGASGTGRRAVNIEWDDVSEITPWRYALATSLGVDIPKNIGGRDGLYYSQAAATSPLVALAERLDAAQLAGPQGILSSAALIDLYSLAYGASNLEGETPQIANRLRDAYGAPDPNERLAAIRDIWGDKAGFGDNAPDYSRQMLTAYAAARLPVSEAMVDDAGPLIASMLAAGLDRDALAWGKIVPEGSDGWALLVLAQPERKSPVEGDAVESFIDADDSASQRRSQFLLAGLAGLGRLGSGDVSRLASQVNVDLSRDSRWSRLIDQAAAVNNQALVAYLAGVGMQGDGWDRMTARQLYHIVAALHRVGMSAEARMIAAEAVARG